MVIEKPKLVPFSTLPEISVESRGGQCFKDRRVSTHRSLPACSEARPPARGVRRPEISPDA